MSHPGEEPTQIHRILVHPAYYGIKNLYITMCERPDITVSVCRLPVPIVFVFTMRALVAVVPLTVLSSDTVGTGRDSTDVPFHPKYHGTVLFKNKFDGQLPATDYPKVNFYLVMLLAYVLFASAWGWLCYQHVQDLLPIQVCGICTDVSPKYISNLVTQYYLSGLVGFLVVEMIADLSTFLASSVSTWNLKNLQPTTDTSTRTAKTPHRLYSCLLASLLPRDGRRVIKTDFP